MTTFLPWAKFLATIVRKSLLVDKTNPALLTCTQGGAGEDGDYDGEDCKDVGSWQWSVGDRQQAKDNYQCNEYAIGNRQKAKGKRQLPMQ